MSIGDTIYTFTSASIAGQQITFNMSGSLAIPVDTPVYPVATALVQTLTEGGDLSLSTGSGDMFRTGTVPSYWVVKRTPTGKTTAIQIHLSASNEPMGLHFQTLI